MLYTHNIMQLLLVNIYVCLYIYIYIYIYILTYIFVNISVPTLENISCLPLIKRRKKKSSFKPYYYNIIGIKLESKTVLYFGILHCI